MIFAGGIGSRMGSSTPKQFLEVDNKPIIIHTIEKFAGNNNISGIVVVCKEEYIGYCHKCIEKYKVPKILDIIAGGETGQGSIYNGLKYLVDNIAQNNDDIVLIHDGVRPVINDKLIDDSIKCVKIHGNSIAVSKAIETVIKVTKEGELEETIDRSLCRNAKAPQCFFLRDIWKTHLRAIKDGNIDMIDSATLMSIYGYVLHTTECSPENIKITTPNDYYMFKAIYEAWQKGTEL